MTSTSQKLEAIRSHAEAHKTKGRATFSIDGIVALIAEVDNGPTRGRIKALKEAHAEAGKALDAYVLSQPKDEVGRATKRAYQRGIGKAIDLMEQFTGQQRRATTPSFEPGENPALDIELREFCLMHFGVEWRPDVFTEIRNLIRTAVTPQPQVKPPIPAGIYFSGEHSNFYNRNNSGMGNAFYAQWCSRCGEFPQSKEELK